MKKPLTFLTIVALVCFSLWMAITHEPKQILPEPVTGTVMQHSDDGSVLIQLSGGEIIQAPIPRQLPKQRGLRVKMEVMVLRWSGKSRYRIKSWSSP